VWPFAVVVVALLIAARIGLLLYPVIRLPLYGMQIRQNLLQIGAVTAAVPALSSTWRVQTWLRGARGPRGRPPARPGQMISDLLFVRDTLRHLLLLFSLMIGGIVVATGALRSAYLADAPAESDFPAAGVLLFGGLFTAMLALLFVPVYADLRALQRRVRDSLSRIPRHGRPAERWYTQRERLTGLLELDSGVLDALRVATLVLGPFIGALATLFVPDLRL